MEDIISFSPSSGLIESKFGASLWLTARLLGPGFNTQGLKTMALERRREE